MASLQNNATELKDKQAVLQKQRDELTAELKEDPEELNKKLESCRNDYIQLLQDQATTNNQIVNLNTELKRSKADTSYQNSDVSKQLSEAKTELEKLRAEGKTLTEKRKSEKIKLAEVGDQNSDLTNKVNQLRQTVADERGKLEKLRLVMKL